MDTRRVAEEYRLSQWMNVIKEQQCSGQNIKEFCQDKGISRHAYFYWRRKIREAACMELSRIGEGTVNIPKGWMQLSQGQEIKSTLDIEVGGCRVTVDENTDLELLKKVCRVLRVL
ncbi:MAG: IS66 family insertion sequence element accessory protein TnpA [Syntrophomonadaceae bacterium]|jgi:putative transposase